MILAASGLALLTFGGRAARAAPLAAPLGAVNGAREIGAVDARIAIWTPRGRVEDAKAAVQRALDLVAEELAGALAASAESGGPPSGLADLAARWREATGGAYDPEALSWYREREAPGEQVPAAGFGMVAEGWAADRAAAFLATHGFADHRVKVGGCQVVAGTRSGRPWRLAVPDPSGSGDLAVGELPAGATVLLYRDDAPHRLEGCLRTGILDPRSGLPAGSLALAMVTAPRAADAAALALALPVLGATDGLRLADTLPGIGALALDEFGSLRTSGVLRVRDGRLHWND